MKYLDEKQYKNIEIKYLKERLIMPETLVNEALLLGHSKGPEKEYAALITKGKDKDLIDFHTVFQDVFIFIYLIKLIV
jgi:hypothetical protein